jgi:hypothetical protein
MTTNHGKAALRSQIFRSLDLRLFGEWKQIPPCGRNDKAEQSRAEQSRFLPAVGMTTDRDRNDKVLLLWLDFDFEKFGPEFSGDKETVARGVESDAVQNCAIALQ